MIFGYVRVSTSAQSAEGVPLATIVDVHLKYGKYLSLKNYLAKLQQPPARNTVA